MVPTSATEIHFKGPQLKMAAGNNAFLGYLLKGEQPGSQVHFYL